MNGFITTIGIKVNEHQVHCALDSCRPFKYTRLAVTTTTITTRTSFFDSLHSLVIETSISVPPLSSVPTSSHHLFKPTHLLHLLHQPQNQTSKCSHFTTSSSPPRTVRPLPKTQAGHLQHPRRRTCRPRTRSTKRPETVVHFI